MQNHFASAQSQAFAGLTVLERGWLSSNNIVLHAGPDDGGAVLIDSGHVRHAAQTLALVERALAGTALHCLINTHLHSDHCGGNASLQRRFACQVLIPPGQWDAVCRWDEAALSYRSTGQQCERFVPDARLQPGSSVSVGARHWQVLATPGHDPHAVMLFDAANGVLITADALWENGFGVIFPELEGEQAFDDQQRVLELITRLDARWVIPGHGAPFGDVAQAVGRAQRRLKGFVADPARHAHHATKVLLKYHLLEVQQEPWTAALQWLQAAPLVQTVWERNGQPAGSLTAYGERLLQELCASGALTLREGVLHNH